MARLVAVENTTRGTRLAERAERAEGFWGQFRGLMFREALESGGGMLFDGTKGVHTHFMRFPIDIVFYDRSERVAHISHALRAWRFSRYVFQARGCLELPAGTARATGTEIGDILRIVDVEGSDGRAPTE